MNMIDEVYWHCEALATLVEGVWNYDPDSTEGVDNFKFDYDNIKWKEDYTGRRPSLSEIKTTAEEMYERAWATRGVRDRKYPSVYEQLDLIFHSGVLDGTEWASTIQAVKDAHPKNPTS